MSIEERISELSERVRHLEEDMAWIIHDLKGDARRTSIEPGALDARGAPRYVSPVAGSPGAQSPTTR